MPRFYSAPSQFSQNGPLHSVETNPDCFAIASLSLQELQNFAYKFNAQFFTPKRQSKM